MSKSNMAPAELNKLKIKLREKFPQLTAADLSTSTGEEMKMLTMVAYKLRKTRQQMQEIIDSL